MSDLAGLRAAIVAGDQVTAVREAQAALGRGTDPQTILDAMTQALDVVGDRFQCGELFVPEMLISARAMKGSLAVLEPVLAASGIRPEHRAVIGSVNGDVHDIGKNLVAMMWRGASFEVIDIGVNVAPKRFIEAAREHAADLIGISALLSTTMLNMKPTIAAIRAAELGDVKVIVGGAPVTAEFASSIGADGFAPDAAAAVEVARAVVGSRRDGAGPR